MSGKRRTADQNEPALATEQYSELNATFYSSGGPHEYIRARLQSIIFTLTDAAEADNILAKGLTTGALRGASSARMPSEARTRYALMESTVLLHHGGEALLRLWLAHQDLPSCPWLKVAGLTSAQKFKEEVEKLAEQAIRMSAAKVASVFLGGESLDDSGAHMTEMQWKHSVEGFTELLRFLAHTITSEATLYNAAKHGLVGLPGDQGGMTFEGVRVAGGPGITYLEKTPDDPGCRSGPRSWWATTTFTSLESNLILIELTVRAISCLWAVANRRYLGLPGNLVLLTRDEVYAAIAVGPITENRPISSISENLPIYTNESGKREYAQRRVKLNGTKLGNDVLQAYDRVNGAAAELNFIDLPLRTTDRRAPSTSSRHFFRFSPPGSSSL